MKKAFVVLLVFSLVYCSGCYYNRSKDSYYINKDNYITVSGKINYLNYAESGLYIAFTDLSEALDDSQFKIIGENYELILERGAKEHLTIGMIATFITAPKCFGDGYVMPIVSLSVDGVVFLEFEEGYNNFLKT